jgi:hypothetical protein
MDNKSRQSSKYNYIMRYVSSILELPQYRCNIEAIKVRLEQTKLL